MSTEFKNTLYYGDNLVVLRKYIQNESIDLIYLDPPQETSIQRHTVKGQYEEVANYR